MSLSHASRVDTLCFSLPALGEREKSYFSSSFRTSSEKSSVKEKNLPYCYSYFYFFLLSSMYLCSCHFFFNSVPISLLTREREKILLDILVIEKFSISAIIFLLCGTSSIDQSFHAKRYAWVCDQVLVRESLLPALGLLARSYFQKKFE